MVLPRYLALTAEEFAACPSLPQHTAWMACHFSPYGTGLTNLPPALPKGSMVILNDRIPMAGHDPQTICNQLRSIHPHCLLLDFQRPPAPETKQLARLLIESQICPTGVPVACDEGFECPLFLPMPPPDTALCEHLAPWQGREIWLEIGLEGLTYTVTTQGAASTPLADFPQQGFRDEELSCHHRIQAHEDRAIFQIWRTRQDVTDLLKKAADLGVTKAVGLWQELQQDAKTALLTQGGLEHIQEGY